MNLDKLQINAVIRSGWQAVDLGFLMAQAWWGSLYLASLLSLLPLALVLLAVFHQSPLWVLAIVWWLKPFWERLPLFIASRRLFDDNQAVWSNIRSLPLKDLVPWLLWRRLSLQRAFDNPVTVLEELKGSQRSRRLRVLHGKYSDVALGNQFISFCCEVILAVGLVMLFEFFIPDALSLELKDDQDQLRLVGQWIYCLAGLLAITIVMPFHTMAGFALYLNRRIELEAWDIEISFRNLAARKRQSTMRPINLCFAIILVGTSLLAPPTSNAASGYDHETAAEAIGEILQGEDFGHEKTVRKWRLKHWNDAEEDENEDDLLPEWIIDTFVWLEDKTSWLDGFGSLAVVVKLLLVVLFIGLLIYLLMRYRGPLARLIRITPAQRAPEILFGLDVSPESLPPDVPAQVMQLWSQDQYRDALGLLYRASLSRLIEKHQFVFRASFTEAECAALVKTQGSESLNKFFWRLTQVWRRLAYGHQLPARETVQELCTGWAAELTDAGE